MVTRYGSQDTEDVPDTQDSTPLDSMLQEHLVPKGDIDSSDEYCQETNCNNVKEKISIYLCMLYMLYIDD